ncbi:MAG: aldehyde dehydrogenase family protein [Opitutales bacterium]|nr:aldehyde dehydrogenase family protein [Opitutales bacterium]MDG1324252.1 aldehyde dehydrogenase family protein [Opitutales bacterium]
MSTPHIPCLRLGKEYRSFNESEVKDYRDGSVKATMSQVNAGIIRRDLQKIGQAREALEKFTTRELIDISAKAGELFLNGNLALGEGGKMQSAQEYLETLSSTSGLPHVMVKRNMDKIHYALTHVELILNGLTRGIDPTILDRGYGEQAGSPVCFYPTTDALGLVMPSNSPAVNSLWLPSIALKIPIVMKPGRDEPWTPFRLIQAFIAAGCPGEAFGFYPTDHEGAGDILRLCNRALIFGDKSTTDLYAGDPGVQVHGPGFSKILIGEDEIENWPDFIEVMASSISDNGGRSCVNASAVIVPKYAREIAEALGKRLGSLNPLPVDDPNAVLSGFANPKMGEWIDGAIDADLLEKGAHDTTAPHREGSRLVQAEGGTYLRPTIVYCESMNHPLSNREFLCPYASVVEVPQSEMLSAIGPTLVVSAITKDKQFTQQLLSASNIERLNLGPISTMKISWDQPHEGNMFEFLYKRRSIGMAA